MAEEVKISFTIDGIEKQVKSVEELKSAVNDLGKETKKTTEEGTALGMLKQRFSGIIAPIKGVVAGMKTLKGAIISTGIGALIIALGSLVSYFTTTEEGSKKLAIATETLSILWGKLVDVAAGLGESIMSVFNDPVQAVKDLGQAIVDNVVERFNSLLEVIGFVGSAFKNLFAGEFQAALDDVKSAGTEMVDVFTGVDNSVEKVKETAVKVFTEIKTAVVEATEAATELVDTQRALRDAQQELIVENANLNKELETQQKIAEDTTLTYDERVEALEKVGEAQVKLAENLAKQAALEEKSIELQLEQESNYEKREELETQLAEATAARIESETALELQKQDAAKITRELELEEVDRKRSINDMIAALNAEAIENEWERAYEELRIQEETALAELTTLKATEEEKQKVKDLFAGKRNALSKAESDYNKKLDEDEVKNKLDLASGAFKNIAAIVGENSKIGKIAAVSAATIDTFQAATAAYKSQAGIPVVGPALGVLAAGAAVAAGVANVKGILATKTPGGGGGAGGSVPNVQVPTAPQFDPTAALAGNVEDQNIDGDIGIGETSSSQPIIKTYVVAEEVTSQQEADSRINNLARL